ncbi:hypothetical protein TcasGA2_TC002106 [Tribolium castaneum]|uniref:Uncharacterized protein n=1 Tax=Tribolium castaneum TaxID=7070 RepID=D7EKI2_TRICA|nr:hypothetical protein TcasGA2_TC002106 [Tribolium castaneum]
MFMKYDVYEVLRLRSTTFAKYDVYKLGHSKLLLRCTTFRRSFVFASDYD